MKKVLGYLWDTIFWLGFICIVLLGYGHIQNRYYRIVDVEGTSMSPTLLFGDQVVVTPLVKDIPIGSIIVMSVDGAPVVHRLIGYEPNGRPITAGDAVGITDNYSGSNIQIIGIARMRLPWMAYPIKYLRYLLSKI
jgi:signal peptidase I